MHSELSHEKLSGEYRFWQRRIFALSWLAYAGFYLCRKNFAIAMPLLSQELGYTKNDFALILFFYSFAYALGQFYNGFLSDRFGPRIVVGLGLIMIVIVNLFIGFSASLLVFGLLICLNGSAQSTGWSGTVKNMAPWFRSRERGVVMSWWATCYVVGGMAATALATWAVTHPVLFRTADLKHPVKIVVQLQEKDNTLSQYLYNRFSPETQIQLTNYNGEIPIPAPLLQAITSEFNRVIQGKNFYDEQRFIDVDLAKGTRKNIDNLQKNGSGGIDGALQGMTLMQFNKTLLRESFPKHLSSGWQRSFWVPALVLIIICFCYLVFTRNKPSDVGLKAIADDDNHKTSDLESNDTINANDQLTSKEIMSRVLKSQVIWLIALMYFCSKMGRYALLFWLPFYLTEHLGYGLAEAGYTSILYEAVGFLGVLAAGYASDKLFQSRRMPVGALGMWGLAIACFIFPQMSSWGHATTAISISLMGFFCFGSDALMSAAAAIDVGGPKASGLAAGVVNGIGSFGQMLSGFAVALIAQRWGWDNLFYFFVIIALIGGALLAIKWNWVPETNQKNEV